MKKTIRKILLILITVCLLAGCEFEPAPPQPPTPEDQVFSLKGKTYETLQQALAQVPSNSSKAAGDYVITLLKDSSGPGLSVGGKDFTLDLGGFTYTFTGTLEIDSGSKVELSGASGSKLDMGTNTLKVTGESDLRILEHADVSGTLEAVSSNVLMDNNAKLSGAVAADNSGFTVSGESAVDAGLTARNGSAIAFETEGNVIRTFSKTAQDTVVIVKNIQVDSVDAESDKEVITAEGVEISGVGASSLVKDDEYCVLLDLVPYIKLSDALAAAHDGDTLVLLNNVTNDNNAGNSVHIENALTLNLESYNISLDSVSTNRNVTILGTGEISSAMTSAAGSFFTLQGGTYSADPSAHADTYIVPLNCKVTENETKYTVSAVTADEAAAQIGEKYYLSLENAILDSGTKAEIKLLKNITETEISISQGRNIALDLNGNDIGTSLSVVNFTNSATFALSGSGNVYLGTITLNSGSVTEFASSGTVSGTLSGVASGAVLRITGGTFPWDPSSYVPAGYKFTVPSAGSWTVSVITEAEAAAKVNGILYMTFEQALSAAVSSQGDVLYSIKLLNNVNLTSAVNLSFKDTLELNLNGKNLSSDAGVFVITKGCLSLEGSGTVSASGENCAITVGDSSTGLSPSVITAEGVTVSSGSGYSVQIVGNNTDRRTAVIEGSAGSVSSTGTASVIQIGKTATVSGTVSAEGILGISGGSYTGTITANSITADGGSFTDITFSAPEVSVWDGTFTASEAEDVLKADGNTIAISGGVFTATGTQNVLRAVNGGTIAVSGGAFTGALSAQGGTIVLTGGTFSVDPTSFLAPGYAATQDAGTLRWTVAPADVQNKVAQVGQAYFDSLDAAISAAGEGQVVTLLKDLAVQSPVEINKTITLVMNGNLSASSREENAIRITAGRLTLCGSTLTGNIDISGSGSLEITGGVYSFDPSFWVSSDYTASQISTSPEWWTVFPKADPAVRVNGKNYYTIASALAAAGTGDTLVLLKDVEEDGTLNKAVTLDLSGYKLTGNLSSTGSTDISVTGPGTVEGNVSHAGSGKLSLTGVTVTGSAVNSSTGTLSIAASSVGSAQNTGAGTLNISACTISTTDTDAVKATSGTVTVSDGTYETTGTGTAVLRATTGGTIAVKGGSFTGNLDGSVTVYGGNYSVNPTSWLASGYTATENPVTHRWTVISTQASVSYVAKIGETYYTSLEAALEAVAADQEILLVSDINLTSQAQLSRDVVYTINLNGHNIDATDVSALNITSGSVTLTGTGLVCSDNADAIVLSGGALTVEGIIVQTGSSSAFAVNASGTSSFNIKSGMIRGAFSSSSTALTNTISGGTFSGAVTISGGSTAISGGLFLETVSGGTTAISGGEFRKAVTNTGAASISGGLFHVKPGTELINDSTSQLISTGASGSTWKVVAKQTSSTVALVTENANAAFYSSFEEAAAKAAGGKLQLLADVTLSSDVCVSGGVVLDLNNHSLATENHLSVTGGVLTLTNAEAGTANVSSSAGSAIIVNGTDAVLAVHRYADASGTVNITGAENAVYVEKGRAQIEYGTITGHLAKAESGAQILVSGTIGVSDLASLTDVVSLMESGVVLLKDNVDLGKGTLSVKNNMVLNLESGKTLTGSVEVEDTAALFGLTGPGTLAGNVTNKGSGIVLLLGTDTEKTTVTGTISNNAGGIITADNVVHSGAATLLNAQKGTVDVGSGTFTAVSEGSEICASQGTVSISGGSFIGYFRKTGNETLTISGGTFSNSTDTVLQAEEGSVLITGGTFTGILAVVSSAESSALIEITGGTFSADPSAFVSPGYVATKDTSTNKWTVSAIGQASATAGTGGLYFNSLADALGAAGNGDRVTLYKNETLTESLAVSKSVSLVLNADLTANLSMETGGVAIISGSGRLKGSILNATTGNLRITGASYNFDPTYPTSYVDTSRYKVTSSGGETPVWTVSAATSSDAKAAIGSFYYTSVQGAVNAASYGQTVQVIGQSAEDVTVDRSLTLELKGENTLTGNLSVTAGSVVLQGAGVLDGTISVADGASLSIRGGVFTAEPDASYVATGYAKALDPDTNRWIVSEVTAGIVAKTGNFRFTSLEDAIASASYLNLTRIDLLADVEITSAGGTLTVPSEKFIYLNLGTFSISGNLEYNGLLILAGTTGGINGSLIQSSTGMLTIKGGTYKFNPAPFTDPDEYVVTENQQTWIVSMATAANAVASAGSGELRYYTSLDAAVENASDGQLVTLLLNTEENILVSKPLRLDLNGHTLTGNLAVDSGSVSISGGVLEGNLTNGGTNAVTAEGLTVNGVVTNSNRGSVTLDNTTVSGSVENTDSGSLTVAGSTVEASIINHSSGNVLIGGDSVVKGTVVNRNGITNISGGSFNAGAGNSVLKADSGKIIVSGGAFSGDLSGAAQSIVITGGTYTAKPDSYVDERYFVVSGPTEGIYTVSVRAESMVAMIGTQYYATIEQAINAVPSGNESTTINLIADIGAGADLMLPDGKVIKIEAAGHTVNRNIVCAGVLETGTTGTGVFNGCISTASNGTVRITDGTFKVASGNVIDAETGMVTITGGKFTGALKGGSGNNKHISITGGTFSVDPTVYVAPGYGATKEGDWWTVTPTNS